MTYFESRKSTPKKNSIAPTLITVNPPNRDNKAKMPPIEKVKNPTTENP